MRRGVQNCRRDRPYDRRLPLRAIRKSNCSGWLLGLFVGIIIEWFWSDPWGSEYLNLWPVIGAFVGFLSAVCRSVKRLVASKNRIGEAVHILALASFSEHGLHYTRDHTGILILVSLVEHRVEVLADRGINAKVEKRTWDEIVHILDSGLEIGAGLRCLLQSDRALRRNPRRAFPRVRRMIKTNCPIVSSPGSRRFSRLRPTSLRNEQADDRCASAPYENYENLRALRPSFEKAALLEPRS